MARLQAYVHWTRLRYLLSMHVRKIIRIEGQGGERVLRARYEVLYRACLPSAFFSEGEEKVPEPVSRFQAFPFPLHSADCSTTPDSPSRIPWQRFSVPRFAEVHLSIVQWARLSLGFESVPELHI